MKKTIALAVLLAMTVVACGGDGDAAGGVASIDDQAAVTTTAPDQAAAAEEAALEFTECLRDEGLDVDDPVFDENGSWDFRSQLGMSQGRPDEATRAALDVCRPFLEGVVTSFEREDLTEFEDDLLAFAQCMRDEGIDWPDPDLTAIGSGGGEGGGRPFGDSGIDMEDPEVQTAIDACRVEFSFGPSGEGS